jgi:ATP adenylyltransferase
MQREHRVASPPASAGRRLVPGTLAAALAARDAQARRSGALQPIATESHVVEQEGLRFDVRVLGGLPRKLASGARDARSGRNPFLPPEPELVVADLTDTHLCLLNKFNVLERHLLVVTRRFEEQQSPLGEADFEALWLCLGELDALAFYNSGPLAGASQRHKHLQLVPLPLGAGPAAFPLEPRLASAPAGNAPLAAPGLPFLHALARVDALAALPPAAAAPACAALYREMLARVDADPERTPYNLLATRRWLWLVPRTREGWNGISVNALGFAGALLVADASALARLRDAGPLAALRAVAPPPATRA